MVTSSKRAYAIPKSAAPRGSWCTQGFFEPSEHLWQEWGLILNMNLPLLPSCKGFSFALGCGVSPLGHLLDRMISVDIQGKPFNIMVIQVYALTSNAEEAEADDSVKTYKTF